MNKVALIDLDNVIADPTARFAKAEAAKMAYLAGKEMPGDDDFFGTRVGEHVYQDSDVKTATNVYWRTAFTPELVALDTLIDGVKEAIDQIEDICDQTIYLTSRPESMRQATLDWFEKWHPIFPHELVMKPLSQQFVKTLVWKSGVVEVLGGVLRVDDLLYVDDEQAHRDAIGALSLPCELKVAASLQEAVALVGGE